MIYEFGISFDSDDERIGAAPLWIVSTPNMGEAAARSGTRLRTKRSFMAQKRFLELMLQNTKM